MFRKGRFASDLEGITDGSEDEKQEYFYYFGEKVYPKITAVTDQNLLDYGLEYIYEWNGITAHFGVWELFGFARSGYCSDIEESYMLYSDWLVDTGTYDNRIDKLDISKRDVIYNLAYVVDAFYLGEFDPEKLKYSYEFLGAYAKPVIYLYPEEETDVSVSVNFSNGGEITCSYPDYNGGWRVSAMPDGTLYDENGREYYCLYWEGVGSAELDRSKGYCVAGSDTAEFLREKLLYIGLTPREANEFIIYWLPLMQDNKYNIITFHTEDYSAAVPLDVSPLPDSLIRVFMTFEASGEAVGIQPQELPHYERNGFTLVEWGGSRIDADE